MTRNAGYLVVEKDEVPERKKESLMTIWRYEMRFQVGVHLDEDEGHLQERSHKDNEVVTLGLAGAESDLEEDPNLDTGVN